MKKVMIILVFILLAFLMLGELAAFTLPKTLIPAEAEWVVHLDMGKFKSSHIGNLLIEEKHGGIKKKAKAFYKQTSIDLLQDVSGVTIYGLGKNKQQTVMCLKGTFDKDYLLSLLEDVDAHREIPHGTHTIHKWNHSEYGLFVGEDLVFLAWNENAIKTALDAVDGKSKNTSASSLKAYMEEIPDNAFFAALAKDISALAGYASKAVILKKAGSGLFTLTEQNEILKARFNATAATPKDAANMEQVIRGLIAMAQMQFEETYKELNLAESVQVSTNNNKVKIEINHPSEEIFQILTGRKMDSILSMGDFDPLS
ncbi:MAG: hypothetical protein PVH84_09265 [Candidatus Aminicenantes bacterium]|jgi:hypothetical protein